MGFSRGHKSTFLRAVSEAVVTDSASDERRCSTLWLQGWECTWGHDNAVEAAPGCWDNLDRHANGLSYLLEFSHFCVVNVGIALVSSFPVHAATWSWMPIGMPP